MKTKKQFIRGFTIIELLVVIVVIGVLSAIIYVGYSGIQTKVIDNSVVSDVESMNSKELTYGMNNSTGKSYYSSSGHDSDLNFTPASGNVIDVAISGTDYCVRGYNPRGTNNSIYNAYTKESSVGVCNQTQPSAAAKADYTGPKVWVQISAGGDKTCAIASDSKAYCWGGNNVGQLGNGSTTQSQVPIAVTANGALNGKTIVSIASGTSHACVIASDNNAYCWGYNLNGQLGNNSTTNSSVPVPVTTGALNGKTIKSIAAGDSHTCVVASDNNAYCWGDNLYGGLGNGSTTQSLVPVAVSTGALNGKTIKSITAGGSSTCVIASDNLAYCWGFNSHGQLGNNSTTQSLVPVAVDTTGVLSGKTIKSIIARSWRTCAVASDNQAYCWGYNGNGQLGNNSTTESHFPVAVANLGGKTVTSINGGYSNGCVTTSDNQIYCWGFNSHGQLGNNSTTQSLVPVAVDTTGVLSGKTIVSISAGGSHNCAMSSDIQLFCWGRNYEGEIGDNSTTLRLVPVAVNLVP
jgi:prepilin-type N-terminal cleavage/methylation domain-containing protein